MSLKELAAGHTLQLENYPIHGTDARYIKITVSRNTEASISEITLYGLNTSTNPPPSVNHAPTVSNGYKHYNIARYGCNYSNNRI